MMFIRLLSILIVVAALMACQSCQAARGRHDRPAPLILDVAATVETEPMKTGGDSADDTTLWIDPADPSRSLIIGTNKQRGLVVYDLSGKEMQFLPDGRMNNVDNRDGFPLGDKKVSLVTASNRTNDSIAIYAVNAETRKLEDLAAGRLKTIEAYGSCMYRSAKSGKFYYFVTSKLGVAEQYELLDDGKGRVDARRVRELRVGKQLEGCVADDELGHLYIGEEEIGIWKYQAEPDALPERSQVDRAGAGGHLVVDVEGLTIAYEKDGKGYLIASSQGNNRFVLYRRESANEYVRTFRVVAGNGIDEVTETDGIHVTTANLGRAFPNGVFIAQDGFDDSGKQNFKLVPWQSILVP